MPVLSPFKYKLSLIKEAIFGDSEIIFEVLECYANKLPGNEVRISWDREKDYIIGYIYEGNGRYIVQAKSAQEFVEMVNDVLYAAYDVPSKYAKQLGGYYRLRPSQKEFDKLNNAAIKKSSFNFKKTIAMA